MDFYLGQNVTFTSGNVWCRDIDPLRWPDLEIIPWYPGNVSLFFPGNEKESGWISDVTQRISTKQWFGKGAPKTTWRTGLFGEFGAWWSIKFQRMFWFNINAGCKPQLLRNWGCWNLDLPMITVLCQREAITVPRGSCDACRQPSCFSFLVLDSCVLNTKRWRKLVLCKFAAKLSTVPLLGRITAHAYPMSSQYIKLSKLAYMI